MASCEGGYSVRFEPVDAAQRQGASKIRLGADGLQFFLILLKVITIFSPLRIFLPISVDWRSSSVRRRGMDASQSHVTNLLGAAHSAERRGFLRRADPPSEQISSLRFEGRRS